MTSEPDLVALLYRADWTRLSLSAEVHRVSTRALRGVPWGHEGQAPGWLRTRPPTWAEPGSQQEAPRGQKEAPRLGPRARETTGSLLIAPGGRYLMRSTDEEGNTIVKGCDGDQPWLLCRPGEERPQNEGVETRLFGPGPPSPDLLCPSWLLSGFELVLRETTTAGGRDVHRVVAAPRPEGRNPLAGPFGRVDSVDAVVDAELGILVRCEQISGGHLVRLAEFSQMTLDPPAAADPAQFARPPGSVVGEGAPKFFTGPGWRAAKTAAGFAAAGLGFAIRHAPRPQQPPADEEATMPQDDPVAVGDDRPAQPVSDALINLLYRTGLEFPGAAAEMHEWVDPGAMIGPGGSVARAAGFGSAGIPGTGQLVEAITERTPGTHRVTRIRFAAPDRYRIDYISGEHKREPKTIACDGQHRWKVYADRVAVGPAAPLPMQIAQLIDASWLLLWRLADGAEVTVHGRPGFRISAARNPHRFALPLAAVFPPAEAVADAELGILLRLTSYAGDRPAARFELRDISRRWPGWRVRGVGVGNCRLVYCFFDGRVDHNICRCR